MMGQVWLPVLAWWLAVSVIGWAALPLAGRLFAGLPDRGYAFSRALGLLLAGYGYWLLVMFGALPNQRGGALAVVAVLVGVGLWQLARQRDAWRRWLAEHRRLVLGYELIGLAAFLVWVWYKSYTPNIEVSGGEKYMEMAFISAVLRSPRFPPLDPWLSGYAISYYHFAYILSAFLILVSGVAKTVGFNLIIPMTWSLTLMGAFGLGYNLVGLNAGARRGLQVFTGAMAAMLLGVVGSLEGALELAFQKGWGGEGFFNALGIFDLTTVPVCDRGAGEGFASGNWIPQRFIWWWRGSRVIRDDCGEVIHEFPFFSFMLGDNHPHVLALPYVLLVLALALTVLAGVWHRREAIVEDAGEAERFWTRVRWSPRWLALPLAVGALGFLNTWDLPTYGFVLVVAYALATWSAAAPDDFEAGIENQVLWGLGLAGVLVVGWRLAGLVLDKVQPNDADPPRLLRLLAAGVVVSVAAGLVIWLWRRAQDGSDVARRWLDVARFAVWLISLSVLFYLPFYIGFSSQASGVGVTPFPARLGQWLVHFGLLIALAIALIAAAAGGSWRRALLTQPGLVIMAAGLVVMVASLVRGAPVAAVLAVGVALAAALALDTWADRGPAGAGLKDASKAKREKGTGLLAAAEDVAVPLPSSSALPLTFALLCVAVGLLLPLGTEFLYIGDIFNARMNTVFKLYYQAWTLLSIGGAYGLYLLVRRQTIASLLALPVLGLLFLGSLYYPLASVWTRTDGLKGAHDTLDGLAWWASQEPDDLAAARWLEAHIPAGQAPVVLQAWGGGYQHNGRLAMATGLPTVLGSDLHEWQWRGNRTLVEPRMADVDKIYAFDDPELALALMEQYQVRYLVFGATEKEKYSKDEGQRTRDPRRFAKRMTPVFTSGQLTIYERPVEPAP